MKICRICKKELSLENFSRNKYTKDKLEYYCKKCRSKQHFKNKKYNNEVSLKYYYNYSENRRKKARKWKEEHREQNLLVMKRWKQKNKEHIKQYKKKRLKEVPEEKMKKNFRERRRRIKKLQCGGKHTWQEWQGLKREYNYKCPLCKRVESKIKLTEDHIIGICDWKNYVKDKPWINYGLDDIQNIQPLCMDCNLIKYNYFFSSFRPNPLFGWDYILNIFLDIKRGNKQIPQNLIREV